MKLYTFDTETALIQPGLLAPPVVCVSANGPCLPIAVPSNGPLPDLGTGYLMLPAEGAVDVEAALRDPNLRIVGHNVAYDMAVLATYRPELLPLIFAAYDAGRVSDTSIREKLIKLALGDFSSEFGNKKQKSFSMGEIFQRRFNVDLSNDKSGPDAWRLRYSELDGVPLDQWPDDARTYAIGDAEKTYLLWCAQASDVYSGVVDPETGLVTNEQEQAAAAFALHLMGCWGLRTNKVKVEALAAKLEENSRAVREALTGTIFRAKDGSKDTKVLTALVEAAYATDGRKPPTTPTGKTQTSKEVLLAAPTLGQPVVLGGIPVLLALASISADEHNLSTYIEPLRGGYMVPITATWNVLVESGRTSCHSPINWQNIPKEGGYRECVEPRPGWVYGQADYSTIELCALAQHCLDMGWDSEMARALQAGRDLHRALAADFLGITFEEAEARKKDTDVKVARNAAKQCNFGFPGGMGAEKFVATVKKQLDAATFTAAFTNDPQEAITRAESYKQSWLARWPEMRLFFRDVSQKSGTGGGEYVLVQPRSGRLRGATGYCDGCNSYFQGLTSDGAKAALFYVSMECYTGWSPLWTRDDHYDPSPLYGTRPVVMVHDEFILEMLEEVAAAATERLCAVMVAGMSLYITDIPIKVEPSIMRAWSKKAEEVRDAQGNLIPWESP